MIINAQALNVIVTLAKCGNFTSASEELHRVPTALSYTLNKLESDLEIKLFHRKGKQLELTEAGRFFIKKAQMILSEMNDLKYSTQLIASGVEAKLNLSINNIISLEPLYKLLKQSEEYFPQTEIEISIDVHDGVWDALIEKRADIAIGAPNQVIPDSDIRYKLMGDVEWLFAISPEHPLAGQHQSLAAQELRQYPAICIRDTSIKLKPKVAWQLRGQKAITAPDYHSKIRMQLEGLGIGFLPRHFCQPYIDDGRLVCIPVEENKAPTPLFIAWQNEPIRPCYSWWLKKLTNTEIMKSFFTPLRKNKYYQDTL